MTRLLATCAGFTFALVLVASSVSAQSFGDGAIHIGGGAGIADPLHGDFGFTAPAWNVSLRARPGRLIQLEVIYAEWRHTEHAVYTNIMTSGPGLIGRIGRLEQRTERVARTAGINVLFKGTMDRVTVWGGGGPAYFDLASVFRQTTSDCERVTTCGTYTNTHGAGSFAVQLTGGLDVWVTRRLAAFGQYALAVPVDDPGSGHNAITGGIRVALF